MNFLKEDSKKLMKGKTGKVYLIDSENINDVWVNLLDRMEEHDRIIVFYTDKSAHMSYEKVIRLLERDKGNLTWIKCYEGQNALDFQLVSVLGAMIVKSSKREYIIVADDCGYDAAVKYWRRCKGRVSRMKSSECAKLAGQTSAEGKAPFDFLKNAGDDLQQAKAGECQPKSESEKTGSEKTEAAKPKTGSEKTEAAKPKTEKTEAVKSKTEKPEAEKTDAEAEKELPEEVIEFLRRLCISVNIKNKSLCHNALINLLGQEAGNQIYHVLAENKALRQSVRVQQLPTKQERVHAYLELILEKEGLKTADLDRLVGLFLQNPRGNLQILNIGLVKKFGAENGGIYYKIIKKHIKVLQRL